MAGLSQGQRRDLLKSIGLKPAYDAYQGRIHAKLLAQLGVGQDKKKVLGPATKAANELFDPLLQKVKGGMVSAADGPLTVDAAKAMEPGKEAETVRWVGDNMAVTSPDLSTAPSTTAIWLLSVARESPVDFLRLWTELLKFQRRAEATVKFTGDDGRVLGLMDVLLGAAEKPPYVGVAAEKAGE